MNDAPASTRTVLILRGLPGSGKSCLAQMKDAEAQAEGLSSQIVSADHFFTAVDGTYTFDRTKIGLAHGECFRRFIDALRLGVNVVIVDNTNSHPLEVAPYMLGATAHGYTPRLLRLNCSIDTAVLRNIHGCPQPAIEYMADNLREPLPPFWPAEEKLVARGGGFVPLPAVL